MRLEHSTNLSLAWKLLGNKKGYQAQRFKLNWGFSSSLQNLKPFRGVRGQISDAESLLIECGTRGKETQIPKIPDGELHPPPPPPSPAPPLSVMFCRNGSMRFGASDNLIRAIDNENITARCRGLLLRWGNLNFQEGHKTSIEQMWQGSWMNYTQCMLHLKSRVTHTALMMRNAKRDPSIFLIRLPLTY